MREPVHPCLGEVERHPDEAGIDAVGELRAGGEIAAPRDEPYPLPLRDAERGRVLGRDLEEQVDAVNATAYSRGGATNMDAARELANCPALAEAWRGEFRNLVE